MGEGRPTTHGAMAGQGRSQGAVLNILHFEIQKHKEMHAERQESQVS